MKIAVTGYRGRIGTQLIKLGCVPLECDVMSRDSVLSEVNKVAPDIVLHLASRSNVDYCENPNNKEDVIKLNYNGTINVASVCQEKTTGMVFLSTDHIFNGKKGPYKEDYKFYLPNILGQYEKPVNYYGLSKIAAEGIKDAFPAMKIVRTSYNFDFDRVFMGHYDIIKSGVATDITNPPTFFNRSFMYIPHLAIALKEYLDRFYEMPKLLHISGSQTVSWYEFMLAVASVFGIDKSKIIPRRKDVTGEGFAPRPRKAGLVTKLSAKLGIPQFSYIDGIKQMRIDHDRKD